MKIALPAQFQRYLSPGIKRFLPLAIMGGGVLMIVVFYLVWLGPSFTDRVEIANGEVVAGGVDALKEKTHQALTELQGLWDRRKDLPGQEGIQGWSLARAQMLQDERETYDFLEARSRRFRQWFKELLPLPAGATAPVPLEFKGAYEDYLARLQSSCLRLLLPAEDLLLGNRVLMLSPLGKREEDLVRAQKEYWIVETMLKLLTASRFLANQRSKIRLVELAFPLGSRDDSGTNESVVGQVRLVPWYVRGVFKSPASLAGEVILGIANGIDPESPWLVEIRSLEIEKQSELAGEEYRNLSFPVRKTLDNADKERELEKYLKENDYPPLVRVKITFQIWEAVKIASSSADAPAVAP